MKTKTNQKVCDLHMHSYYSDGEYSPQHLVRLAHEKKIKVLALTDHHSINGIDKAIKTAEKLGIKVIPAVEIDAVGTEVLGYFVDYKNPLLKKDLRICSEYLNNSVITRIKEFKKIGINITLEKFREVYPHSKKNYNPGNLVNYFDKILNIPLNGYYALLNRIGTVKSKTKKSSLIEIIKLIKKYNGIPVLAHPWIGEYNKTYKFNEDLIKKLVDAGLMGIEFDNHEGFRFGRTPEFVERIKKYAKKYDLILTSGSDFHGPIMNKSGYHELGGANCSLETYKKLKQLKKEINEK